MPQLIAEIAKEHQGEIFKAHTLLEDAVKAGANAVKFQTYKTSDLNPEHANYNRYRESHLSIAKIMELKEAAESMGVELYVSSFTLSQLPQLAKIFTKIKIPSTYLSYTDFVKLALDCFKEVHISTGMHRFDMLIKLLDYYKSYIGQKKTLLIPYHCVSMYPTPFDKTRMIRVQILRNRYGIVGYSDHSVGNKACRMASLLGADYIEKHYAFNNVHKPWVWTKDSLIAFRNSLKQDHILIKDSVLTEEEKNNYNFYKEEFNGIKKCHLRIITS